MNNNQKNSPDWHALSLMAVQEALKAIASGLSEDEAVARLKSFGPNQLPRQAVPPFWRVYLRQFQNPLIYILGIAALVSLGIGELADAGFIAFVLGLNATVGGIQDVALAFEPNEGGVLNRKPRSPKESIFNRLMIERSILSAAVIGGVGFGVFAWLLQAGWTEAAARNALLLLFVLFENFHLGNCRSETKSAFKMSPFGNPILLAGTVSALALHVVMMYVSAGQKILHTEPVNVDTWFVLVGLAFTVVLAMEIHKWTWACREHRAL